MATESRVMTLLGGGYCMSGITLLRGEDYYLATGSGVITLLQGRGLLLGYMEWGYYTVTGERVITWLHGVGLLHCYRGEGYYLATWSGLCHCYRGEGYSEEELLHSYGEWVMKTSDRNVTICTEGWIFFTCSCPIGFSIAVKTQIYFPLDGVSMQNVKNG